MAPFAILAHTQRTCSAVAQRPTRCWVPTRSAVAQPATATWSRLQRRQRQGRWRQHSFGPDPSQSPPFNSEKEFTDMQREMQELTGMIRNFGDFDLEDKKIFVDQLGRMMDKMRVILMRMSSEGDEFDKWILQQQNVQLLNANTSWENIHQGLDQAIEDMRRMIELEESTADPQQLAMIKEAWQQKFAGFPTLTPADMENDPELATGAMHPDVMRAVSEVLGDPSTIENWQSNPSLYKFLKLALNV